MRQVTLWTAKLVPAGLMLAGVLGCYEPRRQVVADLRAPADLAVWDRGYQDGAAADLSQPVHHDLGSLPDSTSSSDLLPTGGPLKLGMDARVGFGACAGWLAFDGQNVFWATGSGVNRIAPSGGMVTTVISGTYTGVAIQGGSLYLADSQGAVKKADLSGANLQVLTASQPQSGMIVASANGVFWPDANGSIVKTGLGGGSTSELAGAQTDVTDLALDASNVYWALRAGPVMKSSITGGGAVQINTGSFQRFGLAVYGGDVYWTTYGEYVRATQIGGGVSIAKSTATYFGMGIAVDASGIYFGIELSTDFTLSDAVVRVDLAGGGDHVLTSGHGTLTGSYVNCVATDASNVYWSESDGALWRVAK